MKHKRWEMRLLTIYPSTLVDSKEELLRAGWEPYAVIINGYGLMTYYFKREVLCEV